MPDLITIARATQLDALAGVYADDPAYLSSLITAASEIVRRVCKRDFSLGSYSEYYSGGIYVQAPLRLRQFPVIEITRIAAAPTPALQVQNLDAVTNQRATVETTPTGLRLVRVASAVTSTVDLAYADYPTLAAMGAQINSLAHGWSATVFGPFANYPSADFKPLQGAANALNGGQSLELYTELVQPDSTFTALGCDAEGGEGGFGVGWRLDPETGEIFGRFPRGQLNIRIDYTAGFATIPQAVQEAAVQLAADLYQSGQVNNSLAKATLGNSSVTTKSTAEATQLSGKVMLLLSPYVDHSKMMVR
jgi:hypothetical protein